MSLPMMMTRHEASHRNAVKGYSLPCGDPGGDTRRTGNCSVVLALFIVKHHEQADALYRFFEYRQYSGLASFRG